MQVRLQEQYDLVLEQLQAGPRTIKELAKKLKVAPHTVRRRINELRERNLVVERPFRDGKEAVYQIATSRAHGEERVYTLAVKGEPTQVSTGSAVIELLAGPILARIGRVTAGAIGHAALRAHNRARGHSMPDPVSLESKRALRYATDFFRGIIGILDQIALDPLWDDSEKVLELLSVKNIDQVLEVAVEFEHWWQKKWGE